ncbi:PKD domain-containing protein [Carboxylicivirga sp. N1Y90]|uniref:PKD domain-containing protein n=1 Tax=Carboxylicivirga fragile TaxID=3417571 RepID=UPI003D351B1A|nr:PD40 domain-containing protein [Marinilabiliaceae bacterium N1Y90]
MRIIYSLIFFLITALTYSSFAQDVEVKKLSVNSRSGNEMAPFFMDSTLYFSSNRSNSLFLKYYNEDKENLYHIYQAVLRADSSWTEPQQYMKDYFSPFNTGSIVLSKDGDQMYIGQNTYDTYKRSQKSKNGNGMGVYVSTDGNRGWSRKSSMPFNSRRDYNTGHPSISDDGRFLFFTSDNAEGQGKTDIYYSEKINDEWGPAINIGDQINTAETEVFPFYHSSGKLFFASDGHGGEGGLDLFYSIQTADGWSKPVSFDKDINTEANEFSCYIGDDEQWGFFASDREGRDNIFRFDRGFPVFEACELQEEETYCYKFFDEVMEDESGPYIYRWTFGNSESLDGDTVRYCFDRPGEYEVKLSLIDTLVNQEVFALSEYTLDVLRPEQLYITCPDDLVVNDLVTLSVANSNLGDFEAKEFYWELDDGRLQKGETIQHIFRTKGKYIIKCGAVSSVHPQLKMCSSIEIIVTE